MQNSQRKIFIVGAGVGGLTSAALLSHHGYDVRVYEKQSGAGGKAAVRKSNGFVFDEGPSILVLKSIYEDLFSKLGRKLENYLVFETLDPAFRVAGRNGEKFYIRSDFDATLDSLHKFDPKSALEVAALIKYLDAFNSRLGIAYADRGFHRLTDLFQKPLISSGLKISPFQKYKSFLESRITSPFLREFFMGFPGYAGYHPAVAPASMLLLPWTVFREGVFYPKGGIFAIVEALKSICTENGVSFSFDSQVNSIKVENNRVTSFRCSDETILLDRNDDFLFNGDVTFLSKNTDGLKLTETHKTRLAEQSPSFFTVQMGYSKSLTEQNELAHHNLFLPVVPGVSYEDYFVPGSLYPENPPLYLNIPSITDKTIAPPEKSNAFLVVSVPSHVSSQKNDLERYLSLYAKDRLTQLREYLPQFPQKFDEFYIKGSLDFETYFLQEGGQIYGPDAQSNNILFGFFKCFPRAFSAENLYLVGGGTQPGAGLPMVIQSGKIVAQLILDRKSTLK